MRIVCGLGVALVLLMLLAACVSAPEKERAKIHCPACGTDFDAFYQKRF